MSINLSRCQQGTSLFEVLIAVLVLSIGLLGVASLQLYGLRYNQGAYLRSQATMLAYDMVDRMRSNPVGVAAGYYDFVNTFSPPANPNCISTGCTPQQLAEHDINEWSSYFSGSTALLPGVIGTVTKSGSLYTIVVSWTEMSKTGAVNQAVFYTFEI